MEGSSIFEIWVCLLPSSESSLASLTTQTPYSIVASSRRMDAGVGHIRSIYFQRSGIIGFSSLAEGWSQPKLKADERGNEEMLLFRKAGK